MSTSMQFPGSIPGPKLVSVGKELRSSYSVVRAL
jgi:hypothetical protein